MKQKKLTKSSSSSTDNLIDIASSDSDTSGNESDHHELNSKLRMPNVENNIKKSQILDLSSDVNKKSSLDNTAEIETDHVQVYPESKWSISGGSVLGLLSTTSENDYSLWLRVKEKQRIQEANTTFFGSTILSLFSGAPKEKYTFDKVLVADDVPGSNSTFISSYNSSQTEHGNKERLIHKDNSKTRRKDQNSSEKTRRKNNKNSAMMKSKLIDNVSLNSGETEKLMLNNGALCATTNINLNDDDDDENFLDQKRKNDNCCDWSLYKGIFYALLSSLFFSLSCVIVKYLKVSPFFFYYY